MLEILDFENVGPAPELRLDLAPRMNFLVGDNGLGKSFVLDVAWWALTRTWARGLVVPHLPPATARILYRYTNGDGKSHELSSSFDSERDEWTLEGERPSPSGLVVYAQGRAEAFATAAVCKVGLTSTMSACAVSWQPVTAGLMSRHHQFRA